MKNKVNNNTAVYFAFRFQNYYYYGSGNCAAVNIFD